MGPCSAAVERVLDVALCIDVFEAALQGKRAPLCNRAHNQAAARGACAGASEASIAPICAGVATPSAWPAAATARGMP
jgi:hypothetical protein